MFGKNKIMHNLLVIVPYCDLEFLNGQPTKGSSTFGQKLLTMIQEKASRTQLRYTKEYNLIFFYIAIYFINLYTYSLFIVGPRC